MNTVCAHLHTAGVVGKGWSRKCVPRLCLFTSYLTIYLCFLRPVWLLVFLELIFSDFSVGEHNASYSWWNNGQNYYITTQAVLYSTSAVVMRQGSPAPQLSPIRFILLIWEIKPATNQRQIRRSDLWVPLISFTALKLTFKLSWQHSWDVTALTIEHPSTLAYAHSNISVNSQLAASFNWGERKRQRWAKCSSLTLLIRMKGQLSAGSKDCSSKWLGHMTPTDTHIKRCDAQTFSLKNWLLLIITAGPIQTVRPLCVSFVVQ